MNRRTALRLGAASLTVPVATKMNLGRAPAQQAQSGDDHKTQSPADEHSHKEGKVRIHYLEIVTPDVDAACELYSNTYGVAFGDVEQKLGGARVAKLDGGGMLAIRGPLRETENPVVRPYVLVEDINEAVTAATEGGALVALPPTKIEGYGQFAVLIHGGIESGLWQN